MNYIDILILILFIIFFFFLFDAYYKDKIDILNHTIYHLKDDNYNLKKKIKFYKKSLYNNRKDKK